MSNIFSNIERDTQDKARIIHKVHLRRLFAIVVTYRAGVVLVVYYVATFSVVG